MKLNVKRTIFITLIQAILNIIATAGLGCGIYSFWCISREPETIGIILDVIFGLICISCSLLIFIGLGICTSVLFDDDL